MINIARKLNIKGFQGVFSIDNLPEYKSNRCGIVNLNKITQPGSHWVAYRTFKPRNEYYDSFGMVIPPQMLKFLGKDARFAIDKQQNITTSLCGWWCIYFLLQRQRGESFIDVLHPSRSGTNFILNYIEKNVILR